MACDYECVFDDGGTAMCICPSGLELDQGSTSSCVDINECSAGTHTCSDTCDNTYGGYECNCPAGFGVGSDLRTCEGIYSIIWFFVIQLF